MLGVLGMLAAASFVWELATGRIPLLDGRGRLRPLPAAMVAVVVMALLGMVTLAVIG